MMGKMGVVKAKKSGRTLTDSDILITAKRIEYEYCKSDFEYFVSHYCVIEDKDSNPVIQPFKPWEGQLELIKLIRQNRLVALLKSRQLGATWIVIYWAVWVTAFHPGKTVIVLSKTEDDSKEIIRRTELVLSQMKPLLSGGSVKYDKTALAVNINAGGVGGWIKAFTASESSGRSFTANVLILDEWAFQQYAREIWASTYPTVNRPTGGQVIGLSTIKRGTLFEEIITQAPANGFKLCFLPWWTDPRRTQQWYDETVKAIGLNKTRQEYPASIEEALVNAEGAFFKEFRYEIHTCEPIKIQNYWRQYTTMDYGLDKFAHLHIAIDDQGFIYVYREIFESNLIVSAAVERIRNIESKDEHGQYITRLAPPDLWNRQSMTGKSTAILFDELGISLCKSNNDRIGGWLAVKELLKIIPGADGLPTSRLKIFRNCHNLIRCMQAIQTDEKDPNDCDDEPHELTHMPDALRGFAISWTNKAATPKPPEAQKEVYRKGNKWIVTC